MNNFCICWFLTHIFKKGSRSKIPVRNLVRQRCAVDLISTLKGKRWRLTYFDVWRRAVLGFHKSLCIVGRFVPDCTTSHPKRLIFIVPVNVQISSWDEMLRNTRDLSLETVQCGGRLCGTDEMNMLRLSSSCALWDTECHTHTKQDALYSVS
jgi:hypothetical protein